MEAGKRSAAEDNSSSSDDSSSDEEEKTRLKEAVKGSFVENVKADTKERSTEMINQKNRARGGMPKKSLRTSLHDDFHGDEILQTTPEFKNFVAKQLSKHLESLISESEVKQARDTNTESTTGQSGIKLFGSSSKFVVNDGCCVFSENKTKKYKRPKPSSESSDSEIESQRLAEAAISADFIIANSSTIQNAVKSSSKEISEDDVIDEKKEKKKKKKRRKKTDESCDQVEETIVDIESNMKHKKKHKSHNGLEINDKNHRKKNKSKTKETIEKEIKTI